MISTEPPAYRVDRGGEQDEVCGERDKEKDAHMQKSEGIDGHDEGSRSYIGQVSNLPQSQRTDWHATGISRLWRCQRGAESGRKALDRSIVEASAAAGGVQRMEGQIGSQRLCAGSQKGADDLPEEGFAAAGPVQPNAWIRDRYWGSTCEFGASCQCCCCCWAPSHGPSHLFPGRRQTPPLIMYELRERCLFTPNPSPPQSLPSTRPRPRGASPSNSTRLGQP